MELTLERLITAIVSHVNRNRGYITKTKLLKLLYLFDTEYYRVHRKTFTAFQWKYFHLGPWTSEYDPLLKDLLARGILTARQSSNPDNETLLYDSANTVHLFKLFTAYQDEKTLRVLLHTWGDKSAAEILDHVYFHTDPMIHGVREQPLDFSVISSDDPVIYERASSGKPPEELAVLRRRIAQGMKHVGQTHAFSPPKYDEEFFEAIEALETMD